MSEQEGLKGPWFEFELEISEFGIFSIVLVFLQASKIRKKEKLSLLLSLRFHPLSAFSCGLCGLWHLLLLCEL